MWDLVLVDGADDAVVVQDNDVRQARIERDASHDARSIDPLLRQVLRQIPGKVRVAPPTHVILDDLPSQEKRNSLGEQADRLGVQDGKRTREDRRSVSSLGNFASRHRFIESRARSIHVLPTRGRIITLWSA